MSRGLYRQLREAKTSKERVYFVPGDALVEITRIDQFTSRKGIDYYIAEFKILWSDNSENKIGTVPAALFNLGEDWTWGNLKQFLGSLIGEDDPDDFEPDAELCEKLFGEPVEPEDFWPELAYFAESTDTFVGSILRLRGKEQTTKNGQGKYTRLYWGPAFAGLEEAKDELGIKE